MKQGYIEIPMGLVAMFCDAVAEDQDPKAWELLREVRPRRNYTALICRFAPHVFVKHLGKNHFYWPPSRQIAERSIA